MARLPKPPPSREITPPELYRRRREFLKQAGLFVGASAALGAGLTALSSRGQADPPPAPPPVPGSWTRIARPSPHDTSEEKTPFDDVTTYNNFYELGLSKSAPADNAGSLVTKPWTVRIYGEVHEPATVDVDQLVGWFGLEERIYRMRCVEAWSMVIPWVGFPLAKLIERFKPTSRAKYVVLKTLLDPERLPGQRQAVLPWPYVEGLRIDEAMNPLTFMALGLYGAPLLGQNGAPLRLVVPWKYGFKGIKSVVEIAFSEREPATAWASTNPREYGFLANVNPAVPHPRWSQATERRIGQIERIPTLPFNGYGEWVGDLYRGIDLERFF